MNKGKRICEELKAIRAEVAKKYDLDYTPSECTFKGNCSGTCPKCDAELADLQRQLLEKGIDDVDVLDEYIDSDGDVLGEIVEEGYVIPPPEEPIFLAGMPAPPEEEPIILQGDVAAPDEPKEE